MAKPRRGTSAAAKGWILGQRQIRELTAADTAPLYLREGEAIPEGVALERVVTIKRVFIDPPDLPAEELPETTEPSPAIERPSPSFKRPLATPGNRHSEL
jgi:hypothetical protein